jgi:hypothetical protein
MAADDAGGSLPQIFLRIRVGFCREPRRRQGDGLSPLGLVEDLSMGSSTPTCCCLPKQST